MTDGLASNNLPKLAGSDATEGMRGTRSGLSGHRRGGGGLRPALHEGLPVPPRTFDAQTFDAVILCYLAAVAAGRPDGADMAQELRAVSGPGGKKYTWKQLPDAVKALQDGNDIDYEGASGPIDLDDEGDPTAGVYDLFRFKDGKADVFGEVPVAPNASQERLTARSKKAHLDLPQVQFALTPQFCQPAFRRRPCCDREWAGNWFCLRCPFALGPAEASRVSVGDTC